MSRPSVDSFSLLPPVSRPSPVEITFLLDHGVAPALLDRAAVIARRQGVSADRALIAEGLLSEAFFYRALAAELGAPFLESLVRVTAEGMQTIADGYARLRAPIDGAHWLFAPRGAAIPRLLSQRRPDGERALYAVTTPTLLMTSVRSAVPEQMAQQAAFSAERVDQELSARTSLRARRPLLYATLLLALLLAGVFSPAAAVAQGSALLLALAFLASIMLRLCACAASFVAPPRFPHLDDAALPIYTIVIALYREAPIAQQLSRAIDALNYPRAKLDGIFVVEIDDDDTAAALRAHAPQTPYEIVIAPKGATRTKPRALNVAMPLARGALVAVFDAEDVPQPEQLRRAASLFATLPPEIACLQASLVIDNARQNWMTALFAMDCAALFDVYNRGLAKLALPIFLGGTSNHFRIASLREIGFWDAFNVTEDADLGLRLARAGYGVRTFDSDTYEEAPGDFVALARQRTRWLKGWMQMALAHCRHPLRLVADLGPRSAGAVMAMFFGGVLGALLGPFFAARFMCDALYGALLRSTNVGDILLASLWCGVAGLGVISLVWPLWLGIRRRNLGSHWPKLALLPLWLAMLTFAAWRALFELWMRPFHWEKTEHGFSRRETPSPVRRKAIV
jgi:cellulose synthase/poly-beta-1,6-N-acetylglucosamine synthase-like glycosyltransferase